MAFFYGMSQVFSRYLKDLDIKFTNTIMSLTGFIILIILSSIFEGNTLQTIKNISLPMHGNYNISNALAAIALT